MNRLWLSRFAGLLTLVLPLMLGSCATLDDLLNGMKSDNDLIELGTKAWNTSSPDAAQPYWSHLRSASAKAQWLGYIDTYQSAMAKVLDYEHGKKPELSTLVGVLADLEATTFPDSLEKKALGLRIELIRSDAEDQASEEVRSLITAGKLAQARELLAEAQTGLKNSERLKNLQKEITGLFDQKTTAEARMRLSEDDANGQLKAARAELDQEKKIDLYRAAVAGYKGASQLLTDLERQVAAFAGTHDADFRRLKVETQTASTEMEKKSREYAYALKDQLGQDFARVPEVADLGAMTQKQVLDFNAQTKAKAVADVANLKDLATITPDAVDVKAAEAMVNRIDVVQAEIRKPEPKGKTVLPVMIGLFNPQRVDKDKSRPGVFRGTSSASDSWWGMTDIPKNTLNDLVVSVNDDRNLTVTSSAAKSTDLVNRSYKVGNDYPVINAGAQFADNLYFLGLAKGKTPRYEGEVTIYKAYLGRIR